MDKYAEDYGIDYCVVSRDIYWFDINYAYFTLPTLDEKYLSQFPMLTEYGSELVTRAIVTDGKGHAGISVNGTYSPETSYGQIDKLISNVAENSTSTAAPSAGEIAQWADTAKRALSGHAPAPLGIVIPANVTLMPGAPWDPNQIIPGAWFDITVTRFCRTLHEFQRIDNLSVSETAPQGEQVQFSAVSAPSVRLDPQ